MDPQRFFYRVLRLNGDHTTLKFSDDILKFDIKVLYQSLNTYPRRLQYCFPSQSILRNNFFQEGQNFLHALLSRTHFSIDSLEEITESVASTVRELFEVGDRVASEHRVIPLSVEIFILNSGVHAVTRQSMQCCRATENCCVCLEELDRNAESFTTPCHHLFHLQCILPWLQIKHVCPLCRHLLPTLPN